MFKNNRKTLVFDGSEARREGQAGPKLGPQSDQKQENTSDHVLRMFWDHFGTMSAHMWIRVGAISDEICVASMAHADK